MHRWWHFKLLYAFDYESVWIMAHIKHVGVNETHLTKFKSELLQDTPTT